MERSERVVRSKAEVVDCRKRTMPLPSERFFAVGSRSESGMDEEDHPGDYGSAPLRVLGLAPRGPGAFLALPITLFVAVMFDTFPETRWLASLIGVADVNSSAVNGNTPGATTQGGEVEHSS